MSKLSGCYKKKNLNTNCKEWKEAYEDHRDSLLFKQISLKGERKPVKKDCCGISDQCLSRKKECRKWKDVYENFRKSLLFKSSNLKGERKPVKKECEKIQLVKKKKIKPVTKFIYTVNGERKPVKKPCKIKLTRKNRTVQTINIVSVTAKKKRKVCKDNCTTLNNTNDYYIISDNR